MNAKRSGHQQAYHTTSSALSRIKISPHRLFLQKATLTNAADPEKISAGIPSYGTDE